MRRGTRSKAACWTASAAPSPRSTPGRASRTAPGFRRRAALERHRRGGEDGARPRGVPQRGADPLSRFHGQLSRAGRDLPSERQSGADLLAALAAAYQVQARLSDEAPLRDKGFDHTTQGAYAASAGVARALGLGERAAAHAIALGATGNVALRVTRTGVLSQWADRHLPGLTASRIWRRDAAGIRNSCYG
jgi:hypothetical protein